MAGRIPPQFIDELLNRVDIVDLINSRVPLKKAGKDYQACCPFHDEKTPSFTVSRDKQFYHCFGCGVHGTAIGFLMEYDHMGFVEAVEELAQREGLDVPREGGQSSGPDYRPLYETLEESARFYRWQLRHHSEGRQAIDYLKGRGLSGEITAEFGIGFAPPGWDNLLNHLGKEEEGLGKLRTTGMVSEPEGKCYDRFRERIMFPIRDKRGRTIAFGGRIIGDGKPKYLNSPETPLFHKGRELYGLFEARKALKTIERLMVVEGYMDVVALAQFGIRYAVATLGTATTADHLEQLFRVTPEVIFCFDGDRAGRDAGWKALNTALPLMRDGREVRFLFLPEGEDPDTMIRKEGAEAFELRVRESTPLSRFLFDHLTEQVEMETPAGRAKLSELALPLLERLPQGVFQALMRKDLDNLVGIELTPRRPAEKERPRRKAAAKGAKQILTPLRMAVALLLRNPQLALLPDLPSGWRRLDSTGVTLLADMLELIGNQPNLTSVQLIERWHDREEYRYLNKLAAMDLPVPEEGMEAEFRGVLHRLETQLRKEELERLLDKADGEGLTSDEKQQLKNLLEQEARQSQPHP
jgi:DNA primase